MVGTIGIDKAKIFYDKTPLLSHNGLINFVLGGRGTGKTFGFKKWAVESQNQTVWVRRYAEDIEDLLKGDKFTGDLLQEGVLSDDDEISINNDCLTINGEIKVWFIALSTAKRKKSQSYHNVDKIICDEFLEEGSRYLKGEVELLLGLYETVNRLRLDERKDCRVFLLANKVSFVNPYFSFWKIQPFDQRFKKYKDGLIVVENYYNEDFVRLKKETKFGKLIAETTYGRYMIDNECWKDRKAFVRSKPKWSILWCNIRYNDLTFGLWWDKQTASLYASEDINPHVITFAPRFEMDENEYPLDNKREPYTWIFDAYSTGRLFFENNTLKDYIFDILQGDWK